LFKKLKNIQYGQFLTLDLNEYPPSVIDKLGKNIAGQFGVDNPFGSNDNKQLGEYF
jgi:hypothetical protein